MEKKKYEFLEMEIIEFGTEDIIVTSCPLDEICPNHLDIVPN